MRRIPAAIILTVIAVAAGAADNRAVTVKGKKGASAAAYKTNYYALVIGNNSYRNLPKLKTAVNDAREVERVLREKYGFKTI